jgi:hypothetical protein
MARHPNRLFGFADLLQQRQAFGLEFGDGNFLILAIRPLL